MTTTVEQCADYIGADIEIDAVESTLTALLATAEDLIDTHMRGQTYRLTAPVLDLAVKQLVSELWTRRNAPGGLTSYADGTPTRLARDAMVSVIPLLAPKRPLGAVG